MIRQSRQVDGYRPMPVLIDEDGHFLFEEPANHMQAALEMQVMT